MTVPTAPRTPPAHASRPARSAGDDELGREPSWATAGTDVRADWLETPSTLRRWDDVIRLARSRRTRPV